MAKVLIIYMSIHHGNTKKVAERMGKALGELTIVALAHNLRIWTKHRWRMEDAAAVN